MSTTVGSSSKAALGGDMRAFIESVLREQQGNAVMALVGGRLPSGKPMVNRPTWFRYPEQVEEMAAFAAEHADEDVYISPVIYGERRDAKQQPLRKATNALTSATIYMDSDSCPPDRFRLKPSIHVQTSDGHGHDYWVLPEPIPATEAAQIAHRITTAHESDGTDPSGWSVNKFLRMPTVNRSYGQPFPITWHETGELYLPDDIAGAYDDVVLEALPPMAAIEPDSAPREQHAPAAGVPDLIEGEGLAPLYDRIPASNLKLSDLLNHEAKPGEEGWRSEQRWALVLELFRAGFDPREVISIAWHTSASTKWREDPRGLNGLWYEVQKARLQYEVETGSAVSPAERSPLRKRTPVKLLKPRERESLLERRDFIDEYIRWADTRVPVLNRPLHEINAWTLLSILTSEVAHVWRPQGPLYLNLYSISIAESSSGKTEASRLMRQVIGAVYPHDNPTIGADHSRNALVERLNERDGKVSFANSDEADATIRTQADTSWAQGMQQAWTEVYDGEVPQQGRIGKKEHKAHVKALVVSHFIGTPQGLYDVLTREMFKSGYLARQVWVRGDYIPVTEESIKLARPGDQAARVDFTLVPRYWARQVAYRRLRIMGPNATEREVHFTDEAAKRVDEARWSITTQLDKLGDEDIYRPMRNRMLDTLSKACGMLAVYDGRTHITVRDVLLALHYVETWLETAIEVVDGIASSAFSRACDEIEGFIAGREGRDAEASKVYGFMRSRKPREVDEFITSLIQQGRIEAIVPNAGGPRRFKIKGAYS